MERWYITSWSCSSWPLPLTTVAWCHNWSPSLGQADGQPARCEAFSTLCNPSRNTNFTYAHKVSLITRLSLYLRCKLLVPSPSGIYAEEHELRLHAFHADLSVFHPNPRVTLQWPQIPPVESSLLQDPAISGFAGQSGDMLMAHRHRRGYRPRHPPAPRTRLTAGGARTLKDISRQQPPRDGSDLCWHQDWLKLCVAS